MQPNHTCSFILRLWRVDQSKSTNWQASIEMPDSGKRIGFASLEQLFAFLMDFTEHNCDPTSIEVKEIANGVMQPQSLGKKENELDQY